jgi:RNA polymerase sigma-70 factor (sigma-E family)
MTTVETIAVAPVRVVAPPGFDERFPTLYAAAAGTAWRILGDREDAADVAQEAVARAAARWSQVGADPVPWTVRVASRLAIDGLRRRRRDERRVSELSRGLAEHGGDGHSDASLDLRRALRALPRRQREVVVLRYLADLPEADVARALGISPGSVKSAASRGAAALRAHLADHPDLSGDLR